jgi:stage V sporulation protein B
MTNTKTRATAFVYNSLLLTVSAILIRTVGVAFNVYISNRVGAEAMGLYSLISNVWGFALTLATSGINLAVTRTVAEALNNKAQIRTIMKKSLLYASGFGMLAMVLLISLSGTISLHWLKDSRAALPLALMGVPLPAIAISSALSGYFSAVRRVWKSAFNQVLSQAIRIFATAMLLTPLIPRGAEYSCVALALGAAISEIASATVAFLFYKYEKKTRLASDEKNDCSQNYTKKIFSIAMPVAFSTYVRSGLTAIEHMLIPIGLVTYGAGSSEALASYGALSGMALPVVLFPYALIHSFTAQLVPEISEGVANGEKKHIAYITKRVWRLTLIFGLCTTGVLVVSASAFGEALYSNDLAGRYIYALAPLMPLMYIDTVTDSILKGMGEQVYTMNVNIADAAISVILVTLLVPRFGIYGYIAVMYITELINFSFSAAKLLEKCTIKFKIIRWLILPIILLLLTSFSVSYLFALPPLTQIPMTILLIIKCILSILLYISLLSLFGVMDKEIRRWVLGTLKININGNIRRI